MNIVWRLIISAFAPLAVSCSALAQHGHYTEAADVKFPRYDVHWRETAEPHRHYAEVNGLTMHYIDLGSGPPVIMIHGIADSTYSWRKNAEALVEAGLRVILVDQPGFGETAIPRPGWVYSVENQGEAILALADSLGLERFAVTGHSLGGGVSLYLAWKHPERVSRIAVIGAASQRTRCPFGIGSDLLAHVVGTRHLVSKILHSAFYDPSKVSDTMIDEYTRLLDRPGRGGTGVLGGICRDYFSPVYDGMTASYSRISSPMLIIWGREDTWHPLSFAQRLHGAVAAAELEIIPRAGHNVHQEQPERVNQLLVRFLSGGDGQARKRNTSVE